MLCLRCHGLMETIVIEHGPHSAKEIPPRGWHCLLCGEITDERIMRNRESRPELQTKQSKPRLPGTVPGKPPVPKRQNLWK
jgi:hypothetical protein